MDERLKAMACRHLLLEQGALDNDKDYFTISAAEIKELLNTSANMALRTDMETRSGNRELTGRAA